jgi:hypothetical protein
LQLLGCSLPWQSFYSEGRFQDHWGRSFGDVVASGKNAKCGLSHYSCNRSGQHASPLALRRGPQRGPHPFLQWPCLMAW